MTFFNGGGHPGAGSGKSDEADLAKVVDLLEKTLKKISDPWNGQKI